MSTKGYAYDLGLKQPKEKAQVEKLTYRLYKNTKTNKNSKINGVSVLVSIVAIFAMLFVLNYRYNLVSSKNLELQRLEIKQTEVNTLLTKAEVSYNQMVNLAEVEAYAKQQLGMQEPVKSQIVYINTGNDTKVIKADSTNAIQMAFSKIGNWFKNIF